MNTLTYEVSTLLYSLGINEENLNWGTRIILLVCVFALAYVITKIFHYFIIPVVHKITSKTKATWDDYLNVGRLSFQWADVVGNLSPYPSYSCISVIAFCHRRYARCVEDWFGFL